jgi:hypothetical protein
MMDMKAVVKDYRWLAEEAEKLEEELQSYLDMGSITEEEANRRMRWFIFQTSNRILVDSVERHLPLPNWRTKK